MSIVTEDMLESMMNEEYNRILEEEIKEYYRQLEEEYNYTKYDEDFPF